LVTDYKRLSSVERAFRTMKSISLRVRPIYHVKKERVIAHIFLCMLSYYVEYHLRKKLAPMTFAEDDLEARRSQREHIVEPGRTDSYPKPCVQTIEHQNSVMNRFVDTRRALPIFHP